MVDKKATTPAQMWGGRVSSAYNLWRTRAWPTAQQLEDSLAGVFPICVPGAGPVAPEGTGFARWDYAGTDQVNYNLNLGAVQFMLAQSWDEFPTLRLATKPLNASEDLVAANERIATILCSDADAAAECRIAMESAMTRGPFILEYGIGPETPTQDNISTMSTSAADIVAAVMEPYINPEAKPTKVVLSPGMDFVAIASAARSIVGDPAQAAALGLEGISALLTLAQEADAMDQDEQEASTIQPRVRARPWVKAAPVGTHCVWDTSVTDWRKAGWMAFKLVYDEEEFLASDVFTDEAKKECKPVQGGYSEGWGSVKYSSMTTGESDFENSRYIIWRIIDKRGLKQHYIAEGYDKFLEKDDTYPFLNEFGRPLLPNVIPGVVRTPIRTVRERPESAYGIAQLAPGWHMQIEFIKMESAALAAVKKTARVFRAGPGVDQADLEAVKKGIDNTIVRCKGSNAQGESDFELLPFNAPPPTVYQEAAMRCMFRFATAVRVPSVAFTGEPIADTLGQEQIALQGATSTQSDIISQYESAYAEMAWGLLQLFRAYAPDEQVQALLGVDATTPRKAPVMGPDGQPVIGADGLPATQEMPSLWDEWKSISLDGHKFEARFASSTQAEDAVAIKQAQDYLALSRLGLNAMGIRLWDEKDIMARLAKMMGQPEPKPYVPSLSETAATALASQGAGMGTRTSSGGQDGHEDDRKAGGGRGAPNVPGRQGRDQKPDTRSNIHGRENRAVRATS